MEKNDIRQEKEGLISRLGGSLGKLERKGICIAVTSGILGSEITSAVHSLGEGKYWEAAYRSGIGVFAAIVTYYNIKAIRKYKTEIKK